MKKIAPDYYDNLPCHYSWVKVLIDFIRNPDLGPKSRIRRTIRSDALKSGNAIDLKNKHKVNEILHEVDNNNNHSTHSSKDDRKKKKIELTNGIHSKTE